MNFALKRPILFDMSADKAKTGRPVAEDLTTKDLATKDRNATPQKGPKQKPGEIGGPKGPEPTRYGDWEVDGRCTDF